MKRWSRADSYSGYQDNFDIDTGHHDTIVEKGLFNLSLVASAWESGESGKMTKYLKKYFSLKWC